MKYSSLLSKQSDTEYLRRLLTPVLLTYKNTDRWRLVLALYILSRRQSEVISELRSTQIRPLSYQENTKSSTTIYKPLVNLYLELYRPSTVEQCKEEVIQPPSILCRARKLFKDFKSFIK